MNNPIANLKARVSERVLGAVEAAAADAANAAPPALPDSKEGMTRRERMEARLTCALGYGMIGSGAMGTMVGTAFAETTLSLTSLENVLDFIGNICMVVGVVLAGWNVVQAGQQMKESGGLQFNQNVWGIIGGIAMAIGGGAIKSAAKLWKYGDAS